MSATSGIDGGEGRDVSWLRRLDANARQTVATLFRSPRPVSRELSTLPGGTQLLGAALSVVAVVGTMILVDGWSLNFVTSLPQKLVDAFDRLTDLGLSGWYLWPLGLLMIGLALLNSPELPRFSQGVLAAFAVRLGFVFTAIAVPGLFVAVIKRVIGRARPLVFRDDVWSYMPFGWSGHYASLPSGHATTAFAALVAIGAIFPPARALLWIYAVMIALSRVVVTAHHPSDVVAGAIVGAAGALLVRNWFAARRLGFVVGGTGAVHVLPGPSLRHIIKAVARRLRTA